MAQFVGNIQSGVNFDTLNIRYLTSGTASWDSPTRLRISTDADNFRTFDGTSLNYSGGRFLSGTITQINAYRLGDAHFTMSGLAMPAATLQGYIDAGDTAGFLAAVFAGNDTLAGNVFNDLLAGYTGNDRIDGGGGNDTLRGGQGNDTLTGQAGIDRLLGGTGDDIYYVAESADVASESGGGGNDYVVSSAASYTLGAGIERLSFYLETGVTQGTGNAMANIITGGNLGARLAGLGGNDTLNGGVVADTLNGGTQKDQLVGDGGNDSLIGAADNDTLNGGSGSDTLAGGAGNDRYLVDSLADVIIEAAASGFDEASSNADYVLPANVENLVLLSGPGGEVTDWDGTGNGMNNRITGSNGTNSLSGAAGADTLFGLDGNDSLNGGGGADKLAGGKGNDSYTIDNAADTIVDDGGDAFDSVQAFVNVNIGVLGGGQVEDVYLQGSAVSATGNGSGNYMLGNGIGNKLTGGGGNDSLFGGDGADTLDGGADSDVLLGGSGNDTYIILAAGDAVNETGGSGTDTVIASVTFSLLTNTKGDVENLTLAAGAIDGVGNALANVVTGNNSNNLLAGREGNDTLNGGKGNDTVSGGNGDDSLAGSLGNDLLDGGNGTNTISLGKSAGNDTVSHSATLDSYDIILQFDGDPAGGQDALNLDGMFDALGVATVDRAGRLTLTDKGTSVDVHIDVDGDGSVEYLAATINTASAVTVGTDVLVGTL
jgi:Ca2+-binding RTX toxin-like protein